MEDLGGEVLCSQISAKEGTNLDDLLAKIMLQAEILDLRPIRIVTHRELLLKPVSRKASELLQPRLFKRVQFELVMHSWLEMLVERSVH